MEYVHLPEVASTNTHMMQALESGQPMADETVVWTTRQTAGRGQTGNRWDSEPDQNLAFSMLLRPVCLPAAHQFVLSELVALAVVDALQAVLSPLADHDGHLSVKWPNDVYHDDRKVAGILIENRIVGAHLSESVVGVGININQTDWAAHLPNPVSVRELLVEKQVERGGLTSDTLQPADAARALRAAHAEAPRHVGSLIPPVPIEAVLHDVTRRIAQDYRALPQAAPHIHRRFLARLYRSTGRFPYVDVATERAFDAQVVTVEPDGRLVLAEADGTRHRYAFKEVLFVLPCGVTKE